MILRPIIPAPSAFSSFTEAVFRSAPGTEGAGWFSEVVVLVSAVATVIGVLSLCCSGGVGSIGELRRSGGGVDEARAGAAA